MEVGNLNNKEFLEEISKDIKRVPIMLVSQRGWGKSSSLKRIVEHCKRQHPDMRFKAFDPSTSWYHTAPLRHRQSVTVDRLKQGIIHNLDDTVYEIGSLTKDQRRLFVSTVIKMDYAVRYNAQITHGSNNNFPWICYIWEEAESYFGSYALRSNDPETDVFRDFITIGRNFKMTGFLVATAEVGEISPTLRRRVNKIYGKVATNDMAEAKRLDATLPDKLRMLRRFQFIYAGDRIVGPISLDDTCKDIPIDQYIIAPENMENRTIAGYTAQGWWIRFLGTLAIIVLFIAYFLGNR
jgi:hypothetical protein